MIDDCYGFFRNYVAQYDLSVDAIYRKRGHTLRVVDNSVNIAKSLGFTPSDIELVELIGLFHDIGRFEQWKRYQSYDDQSTIDHADFGVDVLEKTSILKAHSDYPIILSSISNHNKFQIDPSITYSREMTFCRIIRDADKLDIFRELVSGVIPIKSVDETYDEDAIYAATHRQPIDRSEYEDGTNYAIAILAMFNDIYFDYTKQCIRDELLIEKLTERLIESNPGQSDVLNQVASAILTNYDNNITVQEKQEIQEEIKFCKRIFWLSWATPVLVWIFIFIDLLSSHHVAEERSSGSDALFFSFMMIFGPVALMTSLGVLISTARLKYLKKSMGDVPRKRIPKLITFCGWIALLFVSLFFAFFVSSVGALIYDKIYFK